MTDWLTIPNPLSNLLLDILWLELQIGTFLCTIWYGIHIGFFKWVSENSTRVLYWIMRVLSWGMMFMIIIFAIVEGWIFDLGLVLVIFVGTCFVLYDFGTFVFDWQRRYRRKRLGLEARTRDTD